MTQAALEQTVVSTAAAKSASWLQQMDDHFLIYFFSSFKNTTGRISAQNSAAILHSRHLLYVLFVLIQ